MKKTTMLLASAAMAIHSAAPPSATAELQADAPARAHSAAEVIANVRRAVGHDDLANFGPAFTVVERSAQGNSQELQFGTGRGELRNGREFLHTGSLAWQWDSRRGMMVPSPLRQREKAAWPLWIRGHWWLHPQSGFHARLLPEQGDERQVAIALTLPESVVGATVYVDRATWLPSRVVVPYERGPFIQQYRDWRPVGGVLFPFEVETSYRETTRHRTESVAPLASLAQFERPPVPNDHAFDRRQPASLTTLRGAPFANGTPGHVYVHGSITGREGWLHMDSGADSSIIDESVAEALNMEVIGTHRSIGADGNVREGTWRRGGTLTIGRLRIEKPVFRALDLSTNNAPPGERRMGTLGYDLFARAVVEYGQGGNFVRICDPANYRLPRGAHWQRLQHIDSTPAFPGVAEGFAGLFQLDTGAAGSVDFTKHFHERNRMLDGRETRPFNVAGSGGSFPVQVGRIAEFRLGGETFRNLEAAFRTGGISREGSAGTVGRDVLNRFTLVFDYRHQRLAFLPARTAGSCA